MEKSLSCLVKVHFGHRYFYFYFYSHKKSFTKDLTRLANPKQSSTPLARDILKFKEKKKSN
jgi:hypothetical protein